MMNCDSFMWIFSFNLREGPTNHFRSNDRNSDYDFESAYIGPIDSVVKYNYLRDIVYGLINCPESHVSGMLDLLDRFENLREYLDSTIPDFFRYDPRLWELQPYHRYGPMVHEDKDKKNANQCWCVNRRTHHARVDIHQTCEDYRIKSLEELARLNHEHDKRLGRQFGEYIIIEAIKSTSDQDYRNYLRQKALGNDVPFPEDQRRGNLKHNSYQPISSYVDPNKENRRYRMKSDLLISKDAVLHKKVGIGQYSRFRYISPHCKPPNFFDSPDGDNDDPNNPITTTKIKASFAENEYSVDCELRKFSNTFRPLECDGTIHDNLCFFINLSAIVFPTVYNHCRTHRRLATPSHKKGLLFLDQNALPSIDCETHERSILLNGE